MPGPARRTRLLTLLAAAAVVAVGVVGALARAAIQRNREELLAALLQVQSVLAVPSAGTLEQGFTSALTPWPSPDIAEFALVDVGTPPDSAVLVAMRSPDGTIVTPRLYPRNSPPRAVLRALKGQQGITTSPTSRGDAGIMAYAPGPRPGTVILAIEDSGDLYSPYLRAGIAAASLALLAVLILALDLGYSERARVLRNQERELRTANASLHALIEASPLAIFDLDPSGRVIGTWNPAAERLFGWTREEVVGRRLPIVPAERDAEFKALLARSFDGEVLLGEERTRRCKDGRRVRVSIAIGSIRGEGGRPDRVMAILSDVSDREQREAERAYQAQVLASVGDAVFATDRLERITSWNAAAERLLGWRADEVIGRKLQEFLRTESGNGSIGEPDTVYYRRDGRPVPVETATTPVLSPEGEIIGFVNSARDLTRRRLAERALAESEDRFRRLVDNLPDIVYRIRLRPQLVVEYVGPAVRHLLGYSPQAFLSDQGLFGRVIHPEDRASLQYHLGHPGAAEGKPILLRWVHADGHTVWLEHRRIVVADSSGRLIALEGVARDVTESRRSGEERARLATVIEQADEVVVMTEPDGTIVYVNPTFTKVTGYT